MKTRKWDHKRLRSFVALVICFMLVSVTVYADTIEDLEKQLEEAVGKEKIEVLIKMSEMESGFSPERAFSLAQQALDEAEALGDEYAIIDARNQLGYVYIVLEDSQSASDAFQQSYAEAVPLGYNKGAAFSQNGYGLLWASVSDYTKALENFDKADKLFGLSGYSLGNAFTMNNRGTVYEALGNYKLALEQYIEALKIYEDNDKQDEIAVTYNNIGSANAQMGNVESALDYYSQSFDISEAQGRKVQMAYSLNNIGTLYAGLDYHEESLAMFQRTYELATEGGDSSLAATALFNMASVNEKQGNFEQAFENYGMAFQNYDALGDQEGIISVFNNVGTMFAKMGDYESALREHNNALEMSRDISYREGLQSALRNLSQDHQALGNYEEANRYLTLYTELREILRNEEVAKRFADAQTIYETEKKDAQIEEQKQELTLQSLRIQLMTIIIGIIAAFLIVVIILSIKIFQERQKSEKLLLNILPKKVADTLKKYGKTEPESFPEVTMYFSDIVSFTKTSNNLDPKFLIEELNDIFTTFDNIMESHNCERIKTIGDAYMGVCGLPAPNENHAENIARAALDIVKALDERNQTAQQSWRIRVGIHTGRVTGGVVGIKKYIYDVFGDTVNTASRMESNSEPMRINVSDATYEILKDKFNFEKREPVEVKGKGVFQMYFLNPPETPEDDEPDENSEESA